ncbi:hypothetical protein VC83_04782 [Pseudogymnoascus destructans]|uniref:Uncharacterized protein n=1 Tax=Pseudogymnoascus destructans TaxID=655981 RepID=A0A177A5J7_9PEZI|nr:uncharacterized protein VC83_04782 [Pseudogymnoascus destructans]OAF57476.1 hypothetical protein VC83_04782 [Pseudogymnoascus destructans]
MIPRPTWNGTVPPVSLFENIKHLDIDLCLWDVDPYGHIPTPRYRLSNLGEARNLESLTWKTHLHAINEAGDLGRPLTELQAVERPRPFTLRPELFPKLRYLELHFLCVSNHRLAKCLTTLQSSLQSLILRRCVLNLLLRRYSCNSGGKRSCRLRLYLSIAEIKQSSTRSGEANLFD